MTKNIIKLIGIIALAAVIVFSMAGCVDPTGGDKTLTGISVTTPPDKTQYDFGEELSTAGIVVTAAYSDGSTEAVKDFTTDGYDKHAIGSQTVTIRYEGLTADFSVTVIGADLNGSITISSGQKTTFSIDDELTAAYDGDEEDEVTYQWYKNGAIIPGATESAYTPDAAGYYTVTVSARGYNPQTSAFVYVSDSSLSTPVVSEYDITISSNQIAGSVAAVTVTAKEDKSTGAVTVATAGERPSAARPTQVTLSPQH